MNRRDVLRNGLWLLGGIAVAGPDVLEALDRLAHRKAWTGASFNGPFPDGEVYFAQYRDNRCIGYYDKHGRKLSREGVLGKLSYGY